MDVKRKKNKNEKLKDVLLLALMLLAAAWFFFGCSPCERLSRRCPPVEYVHDSVHIADTLWIETIVIDTPTPVKLPPEYVLIEKSITDTARGETSFTKGKAWVEGEDLVLELNNKDSAEVLVQRIKTLERQIHEEIQKKENTVAKTEYRTRGIVKVFAWIGLAAVIFAVLYLTIIILKRK